MTSFRSISNGTSPSSVPPRSTTPTLDVRAAVTRCDSGDAAYVSVVTPRVQGSSSTTSGTTGSLFLESGPYDLRVDPTQFDRAVEIKPLSLQRPHMRAFHVSWLSAVPGFLGWYSIPPLMPVIKDQLGLTNGEILNSDIASTASTIISRVVVGPLLELYGPARVHSLTLWLGAIPIVAAAFVNNALGLLIVRFFIGLVGSVFVSSQFWTTITFAKNVVGTSNAITGGLGLSGIGWAFLILPYVNAGLTHSVSVDLAWRLTIALPALVMVIMGTVAWYRADSCPMGEFHHLRRAQHAAVIPSQVEEGELQGHPGATTTNNTANTTNDDDGPPQVSFSQTIKNLGHAFKIVLSDRNTYLLVFMYAMSFGTELQLNNMGALYFYEEFPAPDCVGSSADCAMLSKSSAATVASAFGLMNVFARALGGLASDYANRKHGIFGRKCVQFVLLSLCGVLVIVLSRMTALGPSIALYVLVAIATQSAGGSNFGMVPYVNDKYTGTVTGLVGAGGNLGGVIFGFIFRCTSSRADGLLVMGCMIVTSAIASAFITIRNDPRQ